MTVAELIAELEHLPPAAQSATVWVNGWTTPDISYTRGSVYLSPPYISAGKEPHADDEE